MSRIVTGLLWVAILAAILLAIVCFDGCSGLAAYEKTVDSRSIEGYAKEGQVGGKYTVHYR